MFDEIKNNEMIKFYIQSADDFLKQMGYTEHGFEHVKVVSESAKYILETLGYDFHTVDLAMIAGYMHDIGNIVNRVSHAQSSALMSFVLLHELNYSKEDIALIVNAIGNHDDEIGVPITPIAAAILLGDKMDVRRSRVRQGFESIHDDIHNRVNYAVEHTKVSISKDLKVLTLELIIDTEISTVLEYFEIFIGRMLLCQKASNKLNMRFSLVVNKQKLL